MKRIILTEEQYQKVNEFVNEEIVNNRYHQEVKIDVYYRGKIKELIDDITAPNITLTYLIEIEYRHWGIKSINLYDIKGPSEIELDVSYFQSADDIDSQTKTISFPLNWDLAKQDEENGMGIVCIGDEISIHVTENENNDLHCTKIIVPVKTL